jgi:hypothetical protein
MRSFFSHMFIVSFLAPAIIGGVYTFCEADWQNTAIVVRIFGSLVGGFVLLAFVWFLTIPLGLVTSALCLALRELGVRNRGLWWLGGTAIGSLVGWFLATWARLPLAVSLGSSMAVGALTGLMLRHVWVMAKEEASSGDAGACA